MNPVFLSDSVYLHFGTSSVSTGAATNADSTPTVTVAEDGTDMGYAPTVTNVATGLYKVQIDATAGNGFEAGKRYSVYAVATVGGVVGRDGIGEFEVLTTALDTVSSRVDVAVSTRAATSALPSNFSALAITAGGLVDVTQAAADKVWLTAARTLTALDEDSTTLDLDATIRAAVGLAAANLDTQLDALPTAAEIRIEMDANSVDLNAIIAGLVTISGETADIAPIKAKTDQLVFTVANKLDANVLVVNGVTLQGVGTSGDKWRPV